MAQAASRAGQLPLLTTKNSSPAQLYPKDEETQLSDVHFRGTKIGFSQLAVDILSTKKPKRGAKGETAVVTVSLGEIMGGDPMSGPPSPAFPVSIELPDLPKKLHLQPFVQRQQRRESVYRTSCRRASAEYRLLTDEFLKRESLRETSDYNRVYRARTEKLQAQQTQWLSIIYTETYLRFVAVECSGRCIALQPVVRPMRHL